MPYAIIDERMPEDIRRALMLRGFNIIEAKASGRLPLPLASHPDMLIFQHGSTLITSAAYADEAPYIFEDISRLVPNLKMRFTADEFEEVYPRDAIFNALVIGRRLFARVESVSHAIMEYAIDAGLELIPTRQGYPACTVLPISDNAAITSDRGLARTMKDCGIDVLLIDDGGISLPPYEYGFIGGAAGVFRDTVYWIGDIRKHKCAEEAEAFITRYGKASVSLGTSPLIDLGRIIFIDQGIQGDGEKRS